MANAEGTMRVDEAAEAAGAAGGAGSTGAADAAGGAGSTGGADAAGDAAVRGAAGALDAAGSAEAPDAELVDASDPAVFEFTAHVRYSETGHEGCMTLPALINLFQDCSIFHSESIGFGPTRLKREHTAWVLSHWHLVVDRYPQLAEEVRVGTFASKFKTVTARRSFYLYDAAGAMIARADSTWGFVDLAAGKPVRPSTEHVEAYGMRAPLPLPAESRRVAVSEAFEECEPVPVRRDHIDTNEHVNNCQYVKMALAVLPDEMDVRAARVDFKRSAVMGDVIYPRLTQEEDRTVVMLCDAEGALFGVVELRK